MSLADIVAVFLNQLSMRDPGMVLELNPEARLLLAVGFILESVLLVHF